MVELLHNLGTPIREDSRPSQESEVCRLITINKVDDLEKVEMNHGGGAYGLVQSIRVGHAGNSMNQNIDKRVCCVPTTDNDSFDYRRENIPSIGTCR